jgi:hypothetical protein
LRTQATAPRIDGPVPDGTGGDLHRHLVTLDGVRLRVHPGDLAALTAGRPRHPASTPRSRLRDRPADHHEARRSRTSVVKIVSVPTLLLQRSFVSEKLTPAVAFAVNVLASEDTSTSAVSGWKPFRPSAVSVDVRSMPAFSSVVVGAFWLAMVVTQ